MDSFRGVDAEIIGIAAERLMVAEASDLMSRALDILDGTSICPSVSARLSEVIDTLTLAIPNL